MALVLGPIGELRGHALAYAETGLEVFPANPLTKAPLTAGGMKDATTDPDQIAQWWDRHPTALIAHRIPPHIVVVDVDPRHGGNHVWAAIRDELGGFPITRVHVSGRGDGGGHIWWLRPDDKLTTRPLDQWARDRGLGENLGNGHWTAGIDLLHYGHRYTILPPSPHPDSGQPYQWAGGRGLDIEPAPMPALLADLVTETIVDQLPAPPRPPDPDSIADWYTEHHAWTDLLPRHGWTLVAGDGNTDGSRWRHPRATAAYSATIRHGCLFVYSPNTPFDETTTSEPHGYTLFRAWAELEHHGDLTAAARSAREQRDGPNRADDLSWITDGTLPPPVDQPPPDPEASDNTVDETGWEPLDLTHVLTADYQPLRPTIAARTDSVCLFYAARTNALFGESDSGKSWVAQVAVAQQLLANRAVVYVDLEDHAASLTGRLHALGVPTDVILALFDYIQPDLAYTAAAAEQLEHRIADTQPALVVIDSVGEALAVQNQKQNDDDAVALWHRMLPKRLAAHGPAVVLIDHVPKAKDAPAGYAIGSQRKKAAVDGAAYRAERVKPLGRGRYGIVKLTTAKDRNGTHPSGSVAGELHHQADDTGLRITADIRPRPGAESDAAGFRPTTLMERVSEYLRHNKAATKNQLKDHIKGDRKAIGTAVDILVEEGYIEVAVTGQAHYHSHVKPYRADLDWIAQQAAEDAAQQAENDDDL